MSTKQHKPRSTRGATKQQQRDRARRRAARIEQAAAAKRADRRRAAQIAVVIVVVLAVVAALIALSTTLGSDSGDPAASNCTPAPPAPGARPELTLPDPATAAGKEFEAVITTNCGDITIDLDGTKAPQAVASFLTLAAEGFYNDSPCHRLLASSNTVLQCGDPTGTGTGGPGYGYGVEHVPEDGSYPRGTLAMARTSDLEKGTGSQFFIVNQDSQWPPSDGGYTIFGNVTSGMEIVDEVVAAGVSGGGTDGSPALPLSILRIAVTEKKV